jgi:hypothetical protein
VYNPHIHDGRYNVGIATVGRPKKTTGDRGGAKPKTIGFRVSGEYGEWLEGLAKRYRTTVAGVMDRALAEWAASQGYEEIPPERMP